MGRKFVDSQSVLFVCALFFLFAFSFRASFYSLLRFSVSISLLYSSSTVALSSPSSVLSICVNVYTRCFVARDALVNRKNSSYRNTRAQGKPFTPVSTKACYRWRFVRTVIIIGFYDSHVCFLLLLLGLLHSNMNESMSTPHSLYLSVSFLLSRLFTCLFLLPLSPSPTTL